MPRVLITEDDPSTLNVLAMLLRQAPFEVEFAEGGAEALALYKTRQEEGRPFALCVLDVHMPGIDGFQVAETMRQQSATVAIVFLTAFDSASTDPRFESLRISGFWLKPCAVPQLKSLISKALGVHSETTLRGPAAGVANTPALTPRPFISS